MILKSYELKNVDLNKLYLFHGENDGQKSQIIDKFFKTKFERNIFSYFEKDILTNLNDFYNSVYSGSFFEDNKLITIKDTSDKIKFVIEELLSKNFQDATIILIANKLEKKSKLRNFFEKEKKLISIAFYADSDQTLQKLASDFFKSNNIKASFEVINQLTTKCKGERKHLFNELEKIKLFTKNKGRISLEEINLLTNTGENNDINDLINNCLAKNEQRLIKILNENNFTSEDTIIILRTLLIKTKRLLTLIDQYSKVKNIDSTIASFKPPIFWKEKEIVKSQIKKWTINQVRDLIAEINNTELLLKKFNNSSLNILYDFMLAKSKNINN